MFSGNLTHGAISSAITQCKRSQKWDILFKKKVSESESQIETCVLECVSEFVFKMRFYNLF